MKPQCKATGKLRYRDKLGAQIALSEVSRKGHGAQRIYYCHYCHGWHLTKRRAKKNDT